MPENPRPTLSPPTRSGFTPLRTTSPRCSTSEPFARIFLPRASRPLPRSWRIPRPPATTPRPVQPPAACTSSNLPRCGVRRYGRFGRQGPSNGSSLKPGENQIQLGIPPVRDYRSSGIGDLDLSLVFGIDRAGVPCRYRRRINRLWRSQAQPGPPRLRKLKVPWRRSLGAESGC